jgi:hypothetical protein
MTTQNETSNNNDNSLEISLPGFIGYDEKSYGCYATWYKNTYINDGKVYHEKEYLGLVINKEQGIFKNRQRGIFSFNTKDGFTDLNGSELYDPLIISLPSSLIYDFGDIWLIDQIFKQTGLEKVLDNLIPDSGDTIKSLVSFRLLEADAFNLAYDWYVNSYARVLYPKANLASQRISDFLLELGQETNYRKFFKSYFNIMLKNDNINEQIALPVCIDSTGLHNDIKTHLTAVNNHNGVISNEIRLIYVIDQITKLPIYFRYVPGNIIDNSTLINTINTLNAYDINVKLVIIDAGYSSNTNIKQLIHNDIAFLTRFPPNRHEYKSLMAEHGKDLVCAANVITYGERVLFAKKVAIQMFNKDLYAFVIHDINKSRDDIKQAVFKYIDDEDKITKIDKNLDYPGNFILLSSNDYSIDEILPLYYTRQSIEQVFDISKTYAGILPLRCHSEETIRGTLLISFLATILYSIISYKLSSTKFSAHTALVKLGKLRIKIFDSVTVIDELTKDQKELFTYLALECPYKEEKGTKLKKEPLISSLKPVTKKKRGRPKGSKNKKNPAVSVQSPAVDTQEKRRRGRPKGSKNKKNPAVSIQSSSIDTQEKRGRGRPKGSKNRRKSKT